MAEGFEIPEGTKDVTSLIFLGNSTAITRAKKNGSLCTMATFYKAEKDIL